MFISCEFPVDNLWITFLKFFLTIPGRYVIIDCREEKTPPGGFHVDLTFVSFWHYGANAPCRSVSHRHYGAMRRPATGLLTRGDFG